MTNKAIAMTISKIEKSSKEFKKAHKIKVFGPYDDEQMPKWFARWFEAYDKKLDEKFNHLELRINNLVQKNNLKE